jgi:hypothetical protein
MIPSVLWSTSRPGRFTQGGNPLSACRRGRGVDSRAEILNSYIFIFKRLLYVHEPIVWITISYKSIDATYLPPKFCIKYQIFKSTCIARTNWKCNPKHLDSFNFCLSLQHLLHVTNRKCPLLHISTVVGNWSQEIGNEWDNLLAVLPTNAHTPTCFVPYWHTIRECTDVWNNPATLLPIPVCRTIASFQCMNIELDYVHSKWLKVWVCSRCCTLSP